jgi:cellulose synthase/poly-beta-1,6-N-acetylglucosamine synthase-like glycosyltransferase
MAFLVLVLLLVVQFIIPFWMRGAFKRAGLGSSSKQIFLFLMFELGLALSIFLAFFASWFSYWVMAQFVVPWATGVNLIGDFWDSPITGRGVMALVILIFCPVVLFFKVGLLSVRDVHQICKEQRDRVKKRHQLSRFWESF